MLNKRSRGLSKVRVASMAGTLQPNPNIIGTKALPGSPRERISLSIAKVARAM